MLSLYLILIFNIDLYRVVYIVASNLVILFTKKLILTPQDKRPTQIPDFLANIPLNITLWEAVYLIIVYPPLSRRRGRRNFLISERRRFASRRRRTDPLVSFVFFLGGGSGAKASRSILASRSRASFRLRSWER
ncbi:hypothetical protein CCYS_00435 [Corynebacterium cystitidis DSM 20524]|uniref:Uncharacterized protein n=1 Tax=Corynebacterium cystitidis DSM 20524 TaxID=1121357 RepID=A0A1H9UPI8_9CORY|nr:hypothetical protein CCYS_00435 [Corynebacterium cystitidis DSM 20524]SES11385.1 hypothetical protein SAMN05661109_01914 [Corynebacterium cystitidis DSM 20524]SNV90220.1 Uncharacterised protein [Corynebacterium cystitidis]